MRISNLWVVLSSAMLVMISANSHADNAALVAGGHPKMMTSHPSIRMESEDVRIDIRAERVYTIATFVFVNDGARCSVKMGFPDTGLWAYAAMTNRKQSLFKKYSSSVDGKLVSTKIEKGSGKNVFWQTKTISFPTHSRRIVIEKYETEVGGVTNKFSLGAGAYIVNTGASWKGTIQKAKITFVLNPETEVMLPLRLTHVDPKLGDRKFLEYFRNAHDVLAMSQSKPKINGREVTYQFSNWKPSKEDDMYVFFRYPQSVIDRERAKAKAERTRLKAKKG